MKNPGKLGVSVRVFHGAWYSLKQGIHFKHKLKTKWVMFCVINSIKHTNLSIKLGFISRLYIVKPRKGMLFNKMSPTRPAGTQIKIGSHTLQGLNFISDISTNVCRSPFRCLSRSFPWWTRPQFSTNKLKTRCPWRKWILLCILSILPSSIHHYKPLLKAFIGCLRSLFDAIPYHQEPPALLVYAWKGRCSFCLQIPGLKIITEKETIRGSTWW